MWPRCFGPSRPLVPRSSRARAAKTLANSSRQRPHSDDRLTASLRSAIACCSMRSSCSDNPALTPSGCVPPVLISLRTSRHI